MARFLTAECFAKQVINRALFISVVFVIVDVCINAPLVQVVRPHYQSDAVTALSVRVRTFFMAFRVETLKL